MSTRTVQVRVVQIDTAAFLTEYEELLKLRCVMVSGKSYVQSRIDFHRGVLSAALELYSLTKTSHQEKCPVSPSAFLNIFEDMLLTSTVSGNESVIRECRALMLRALKIFNKEKRLADIAKAMKSSPNHRKRV